MKIRVKKMREIAILPQYQSEFAAGFDFHAAIPRPEIIKPREMKIIPTGIAVEIPENFELQVRPRSGLAFKFRVLPVNAVGTIDADFRGEIMVGLVNNGEKNFVVEPNMRIAQGIVAQVEKVEWQEVCELSETLRGENGFGSTGK